MMVMVIMVMMMATTSHLFDKPCHGGADHYDADDNDSDHDGDHGGDDDDGNGNLCHLGQV